MKIEEKDTIFCYVFWLRNKKRFTCLLRTNVPNIIKAIILVVDGQPFNSTISLVLIQAQKVTEGRVEYIKRLEKLCVKIHEQKTAIRGQEIERRPNKTWAHNEKIYGFPLCTRFPAIAAQIYNEKIIYKVLLLSEWMTLRLSFFEAIFDSQFSFVPRFFFCQTARAIIFTNWFPPDILYTP